jgi:superfamily II DNA or RNA helicase
MKLRSYQLSAVRSTIEGWKESRTTLGVMPTGCGKTVVFASIIGEMAAQGLRTMVLAHRQELIFQARDKITAVTGLGVDVEMGELKAQMSADLFAPKSMVVVSTIQTHVAGGDGGGRIGKFDPKDFGCLIIDEAHHAISPSYRKVIDYYMTNPALKVLGVTATPDRSDEAALGQVFESVAFDYEILDAIKDGWLVPIEQQMVSVESLDFSSVRTTAGDLNGADLASVMEMEKNLHGIAGPTIDIIGDKRGIGFAASVNHARILSDIFNRHRSNMSAFVCGKTDEVERKQTIAKFAAGKIQWLWNCGVFTEGFDDSGVEVISMARPTKSRALYSQMAGRATRPHESIAHQLNNIAVPTLRRGYIARSVKPSCLIVDFVGNSGKHKLMTTADILGGNLSDEAMEAAVSKAIREGRPVRMDKSVEEEEKRLEEIKQKREQEAARKARLTAKTTYKTQKIDPFDILQIKPNVKRGWDEGKQLTPKQTDILRKAGFDPEQMEFARAKQLVGIIIERWNNKKCSIKQAATLKRFGYDTEMTFEAARKTLDEVAKNGWKRPEVHEAPDVSPMATAMSAGACGDDSDSIPF